MLRANPRRRSALYTQALPQALARWDACLALYQQVRAVAPWCASQAGEVGSAFALSSLLGSRCTACAVDSLPTHPGASLWPHLPCS